MVNPLIIKNAAAAAAGAKAASAKIAMSDKAAKGVSSAFKSIEETTKLGGFQSLENFSNNIKNSGPAASAMSVLSAQFTSGTMTSQIGLMESLLNLFSSEGGQAAIANFTDLISSLIDTGSEMVNIVNALANSDLQSAAISFGNILENLAWVVGKDPDSAPSVDPSFFYEGGGNPLPYDTLRPGYQEYDGF